MLVLGCQSDTFYSINLSDSYNACVHTCACTGEVISEGADDADDSGYHAERDDIVTDEDHVTAVSNKGKAEVQVSSCVHCIVICCIVFLTENGRYFHSYVRACVLLIQPGHSQYMLHVCINYLID